MSDLLQKLAPKLRHDLRGPLLNIKMGLQLLEGDGENAELVSSLLGELDRAQQLVGKLVDLAAAEAPKKVGLRLAPVVHQFATESQAEVGQIDDLTIAGDPDLVLKTLVYLGDNATQAGADKVLVELVDEGTAARLTVEDSGPGLEEELWAKVLEPGFSTRARNGLGLAITRTVCESHGGSLEIGRSQRLGGLAVTARFAKETA